MDETTAGFRRIGNQVAENHDTEETHRFQALDGRGVCYQALRTVKGSQGQASVCVHVILHVSIISLFR